MELAHADRNAPLPVEPTGAPSLPVEGHLVRAVRAAEAAKSKAETVLAADDLLKAVSAQAPSRAGEDRQ